LGACQCRRGESLSQCSRDTDGEPGDAPGVQPAIKPSHRPRKGMQWNGKATAIRNTEGELTAYAGAWVSADAEDQTSTVEPAARPGGRPPTGKVWNGKAHATMNAEGMITAYTGEYVEPRPDDVSSDNSGDDLEQQSSPGGRRNRHIALLPAKYG
jgi:hypothetical protein